MSELGKLGVYIAGTTLPSEDRTELYDVYADLDKGTVVVAEVIMHPVIPHSNMITLGFPTHSPGHFLHTFARESWSSQEYSPEQMAQSRIGFSDIPLQSAHSSPGLYIHATPDSLHLRQGARSELGFTSVHKDVATFLVSAAEKDQPAYETIQGIPPPLTLTPSVMTLSASFSASLCLLLLL
jgi:hypothetical protein